MAIPKPREKREPRRPIKTTARLVDDDRLTAAKQEAAAAIAERDDYWRDWDRVASRRNLLVDALNRIIDDLGYAMPQAKLVKEIRAQIERDDRELAALNTRRCACAMDSETLEDATRRCAITNGMTPYAWARVSSPDTPTAEIADTSEKVMAQSERKTMLGYYERSRAEYLDLLEDDRNGCSVFVPIGETFRDRHGRLYRSRFATRDDLDRELGKIERAIEQLVPRGRTTKT